MNFYWGWQGKTLPEESRIHLHSAGLLHFKLISDLLNFLTLTQYFKHFKLSAENEGKLSNLFTIHFQFLAIGPSFSKIFRHWPNTSNISSFVVKMKEILPFQFVLPFTFTFFFNGLFSSDNHHKGINIIKALPQYNQDSNLYIQISKTLKMSKCFPLQLIYAIHFHFLFQLIFFQLHHSKTRATHWKTPMFVVLKSFQVWPDDSSIGSGEGEGRGSANTVLSILKGGGKGRAIGNFVTNPFKFWGKEKDIFVLLKLPKQVSR